MIRLDNVTVRHARSGKDSSPPALSRVSLGVAPGEMTGLLGPNGSGKTTLLRTVSGSLAPQSGQAFLAGDAVRSLSHKERARRMAFVPQKPESVPDYPVFDMVLMGRYAHKQFLEHYSAEDEAVVLAALAETAVGHLADRPARTLSGGELQRVYAARAFAQAAPVLLLDEPATGLDPAHAAALFDRIRARNLHAGATVLMAIHDLNLAALYCDRLVFLKRGEIAADGPVRAVFTAATLAMVYDADFLIVGHPKTGLPQALPLPGNVSGNVPVQKMDRSSPRRPSENDTSGSVNSGNTDQGGRNA